MPYTTDKMKLPRVFDRRVKLTSADKKMITKLHRQGMSQRKIASRIGISRRMVIFICYPERLARAKKLYRLRRLDGRYYNREKHRIAIRNTRRYKHFILTQYSA